MQAKTAVATGGTALGILAAISLSHGINDLLQAVSPALYPVFKSDFGLSFAQVGIITLCFQLTASILQPIVGAVTDRKPMPFSLPVGMALTLCGITLLSMAWSYPVILAAAAMIGTGSAIFHPESSRIARMASGGRHGFAQSLFQVGGNVGTSLGPLAAAYLILPNGQRSIAWFGLVALAGVAILANVGLWARRTRRAQAAKAAATPPASPVPRDVAIRSIALLGVLVFSKFLYTASMSNYYTFYLIDTFHVDVRTAQLCLFAYLAAFAAGTFAGGPIGDRYGRKFVIWFSILGALPFTLLMPHVGFWATVGLSLVIGFVLASAFSSIVVFAMELAPAHVGTIAGMFFGFAFGMGGIGAASLGWLADRTSIGFVYLVCSFLPAIGLLTWFLPTLPRKSPIAVDAAASAA
ncbi:MAG: MFS transporter, partial [Hyphomicrobiales bacterium]|nr:MFS transporter [Hyphomicrobiales bacterium]